MSASAKRRKTQILRHARLSDIPDDFSRQIAPVGGSFQGNCMFPRMPCSPPQFGISSSIPSMFPGMMPIAQSPVAMSPDDASHKYVFKNHFERTVPQRYPEIVVNGQLADVNGVVRSIILERDPAPPIFTEGEQPSMVCPLSRVPITCPGRGVNCRHPGCFDIRQFLLLSPGDASVCPICGAPLPFEEIRFDPQFFTPKQTPDFRPVTPGKEDSLDMLW